MGGGGKEKTYFFRESKDFALVHSSKLGIHLQIFLIKRLWIRQLDIITLARY